MSTRRRNLGLGALGVGWLGANLVIAAGTCHPAALGRVAGLRGATRSLTDGGFAARQPGGTGARQRRRVVTPEELATRYRRVEYRPARTGWWSPGTAGRPPVVVAHGYCVAANAVGSDAAPVTEVACHLQAEGYPVLALTFGYVTGAYPFGAGWREAEDVRAACAWMAAETGAPAVVWGFSAGGHAALLAASAPGPVSAVVSDGAFTDLVEVVRAECVRRSHLPRSLFGALRPAISLMACAAPVDLSRYLQGNDYPVRALIIHAGLDDIVPSRAAAVLAGATGGQVWEIPGAAHTQGYGVARDAYFAKVQQLLNDVCRFPDP